MLIQLSPARRAVAKAEPLFLAGRFTEALAVTEEMERQAKTLKLPSLEAQAWRVRAGALDAQGKPDAALTALEKALGLFRNQKDGNNEAQTLRAISSILAYQGQTECAKEYLEKAKAIEASLQQ